MVAVNDSPEKLDTKEVLDKPRRISLIIDVNEEDFKVGVLGNFNDIKGMTEEQFGDFDMDISEMTTGLCNFFSKSVNNGDYNEAIKFRHRMIYLNCLHMAFLCARYNGIVEKES